MSEKATERAERALELARQTALAPIASQEQADRAAGLLTEIVGIRKAVKEEFEPMLKAAREALESVRETYKRYDEPLGKAESDLRRLLSGWAEEKRRREEEAARRAAEEARARIEERVEAMLEEVEDAELAKAICEQAEAEIRSIEIIPAVKPKVTENSKGVTVRETWRAEVVDMRALCASIASGRAPVSLVSLRQAEADKLASLYREELAGKVPGLAARKYTSTVVRAR